MNSKYNIPVLAQGSTECCRKVCCPLRGQFQVQGYLGGCQQSFKNREVFREAGLGQAFPEAGFQLRKSLWGTTRGGGPP
jgi:hypothetical protein